MKPDDDKPKGVQFYVQLLAVIGVITALLVAFGTL